MGFGTNLFFFCFCFLTPLSVPSFHPHPIFFFSFFFFRVNGQYIMEGLASSFLFTMGGIGFIILDRSNAPNIPKLNRFLLLFIGFVSVLLSFFMARVFMRMKLP